MPPNLLICAELNIKVSSNFQTALAYEIPVPSSANSVGVPPIDAVAVSRSLKTNDPSNPTYMAPYSELATVCIAFKEVRGVPGSACNVV